MNTYIVTLKLARNPGHNPAAKITAPWPLSELECTDQTGQHHSVLIEADGDSDTVRRYLLDCGKHVTRIEYVMHGPTPITQLAGW